MLIKSDFTDYYDSMQKLGIDHHLVYNRFQTTNKIKMSLEKGWRAEARIWQFDFEVIGVYPNRYLLYTMSHGKYPDQKYEYIYDIDKIKELIKLRYPTLGKWYYKSWTKANQAKLDYAIAEYQNVYHFNAAPVWLLKGDKIHLNIRLRSYDFNQVLDMYSVYQNISAWVSNQAEPRKEIPVPSDKDMVSIKGFDPKYSFRKEPTKKRKK